MMWLDLIDILFMFVGFILGYIFCCLQNRDTMNDECKDCVYREYIMEVIDDERND